MVGRKSLRTVVLQHTHKKRPRATRDPLQQCRLRDIQRHYYSMDSSGPVLRQILQQEGNRVAMTMANDGNGDCFCDRHLNILPDSALAIVPGIGDAQFPFRFLTILLRAPQHAIDPRDRAFYIATR
jgi:hypothetical protein